MQVRILMIVAINFFLLFDQIHCLQKCFDWKYPRSFNDSTGNSFLINMDLDGSQNIIILGMTNMSSLGLPLPTAKQHIYYQYASADGKNDWVRVLNKPSHKVPISIKFQQSSNSSQKAMLVAEFDGDPSYGVMHIIMINTTNGEIMAVFKDNTDAGNVYYILDEKNSVIFDSLGMIYMGISVNNYPVLVKYDFNNLNQVSLMWKKEFRLTTITSMMEVSNTHSHLILLDLIYQIYTKQWLPLLQMNKISYSAQMGFILRFTLMLRPQNHFRNKFLLIPNKIKVLTFKNVSIMNDGLFLKDLELVFGGYTFQTLNSRTTYTSIIQISDTSQSCSPFNVDPVSSNQTQLIEHSTKYTYLPLPATVSSDIQIILLVVMDIQGIKIDISKYSTNYNKLCNQIPSLWTLSNQTTIVEFQPIQLQNFSKNVSTYFSGDEVCLDKSRKISVNPQNQNQIQLNFDGKDLLSLPNSQFTINSSNYNIECTYPSGQTNSFILSLQFIDCKVYLDPGINQNLTYNIGEEELLIDLNMFTANQNCPYPNSINITIIPELPKQSTISKSQDNKLTIFEMDTNQTGQYQILIQYISLFQSMSYYTNYSFYLDIKCLPQTLSFIYNGPFEFILSGQKIEYIDLSSLKFISNCKIQNLTLTAVLNHNQTLPQIFSFNPQTQNLSVDSTNKEYHSKDYIVVIKAQTNVDSDVIINDTFKIGIKIQPNSSNVISSTNNSKSNNMPTFKYNPYDIKAIVDQTQYIKLPKIYDLEKNKVTISLFHDLSNQSLYLIKDTIVVNTTNSDIGNHKIQIILMDDGFPPKSNQYKVNIKISQSNLKQIYNPSETIKQYSNQFKAFLLNINQIGEVQIIENQDLNFNQTTKTFKEIEIKAWLIQDQYLIFNENSQSIILIENLTIYQYESKIISINLNFENPETISTDKDVKFNHQFIIPQQESDYILFKIYYKDSKNDQLVDMHDYGGATYITIKLPPQVNDGNYQQIQYKMKLKYLKQRVKQFLKQQQQPFILA
ncbi:UNKNOWN [Stylonychia lemnae]|uniref:Cadg domain containing protein n=1 Tax=Stylonychia lemnae TaxID=5949 RepID=A0A078AA81_STYLE|nr:UNKNOWN [Stylonychia lemnae]|eukprot:CDW78791.1 UNKNOWN [Stylonychia lemnae]